MEVKYIKQKRIGYPNRHYGELKEDKIFCKFNGHYAKPEFTEYLVKAGTTVKIVMVFRFGDVGITTDLKSEYGYDARVKLEDLDNLRESL